MLCSHREREIRPEECSVMVPDQYRFHTKQT